jgi:hypothetical protein
LDYIQEELSRQRRALVALMVGGSGETQISSSEASASKSAEGRETLAAILAAAVAGDLTDRTVLLDGGAVAELAAQRVREKLAGSTEPSGTAASQSETEAATDSVATATEESDVAAAMRNTAAERRGTVRAGAVSRRQTGAATLRTNAQTAGGDVAAVWAAAGSVSRNGTDVREVSRAVQRDARRYDGGFSIY